VHCSTATGLIFKAAAAKRARPLRLQSRDRAAVYVSAANVKKLAPQLDLGKVESVDLETRRIVNRLEEGKLPL
jgi:hypothetical protein